MGKVARRAKGTGQSVAYEADHEVPLLLIISPDGPKSREVGSGLGNEYPPVLELAKAIRLGFRSELGVKPQYG